MYVMYYNLIQSNIMQCDVMYVMYYNLIQSNRMQYNVK